jgi:hypothetical protein
MRVSRLIHSTLWREHCHLEIWSTCANMSNTLPSGSGGMPTVLPAKEMVACPACLQRVERARQVHGAR